MAAMTIRGSRALLGAGAALLAARIVLGAPAAPRTAPRHGVPSITTQHGTISVDADKTEVDYSTHQMRLKNVVITQGDLSVTADSAEAAGISFDNSRWVFTGNVHISSTQLGALQSDSATVDFLKDRLENALVKGNPAEFEQTTSKSGVLARGHADTIEYTVSTDTVRLTGNARLQYGGTETTAPVMVYNIREQRLQFAGAAAPGGRVHIIATPPKSAKPPATPHLPSKARQSAASSAPGQP